VRFLATTLSPQATELFLLSAAGLFILFALFVLWATKGKFTAKK